MNIEKKIKDNIWIVLLLITVAVGTTLYSILNYYFEKEIEKQESTCALMIEEMKSRVQSIERNLGGVNYFDVRNLLINKSELATIEKNTKYNKQGNFFALDDGKYWNYLELTELDNMLKTYNLSIHDLSKGPFGNSNETYLLPFVKTYSKNHPVYSWWSKDSIIFEHTAGDMTLYTKASVQNLTFDYLKKLDAYGLLKSTNPTQSLSNNKKSGLMVFLQRYSKQSDHDRIGNMLSHYVTQKTRFSTVYPDVVVNIQELEKLDNLCYSRVETQFNNCKIDTINNATVYNIEEIFWLKRANYISIVSISYPSLEPRIPQEIAFEVNLWLNKLKLMN